MPKGFIKDIKRVFTYYAVGSIIAFAIHQVIGWENKALMPPSILVLLILSLMSIPWACLNLSNLINPVQRPRNLAELFVHSIFIFLFSVLILNIHAL